MTAQQFLENKLEITQFQTPSAPSLGTLNCNHVFQHAVRGVEIVSN
jgi:hypothetical protein